MEAISTSKEAIENPVSQKELAQRFGLNARTVEALRKQNKIPFIRAGRRILYQPSKVVKALEVDPQNS
jgi:excisionase family DNA binding protein